MSDRRRFGLLGFLILSGVAMVLVAGALPSLTFLPEQGSAFVQVTQTPAAVLDLGWIFSAVLALVVLAFVFLTPASLRRRLLYAVVALMGIAALTVFLVWLAGDTPLELPVAPPVAQLTPTAEAIEETVVVEEAPVLGVESYVPPSRRIGMAIVVAVGVLLIISALVVLGRVREREAPVPPLQQLAQEAQLALDALSGGEDVRDVILRCYHEMGRVLDQTQGIRRVETATPREFAAQLGALGLPPEPVATLTALFEEARYGGRPTEVQTAQSTAQRAIASLRAIIAACEVER